ncbi:RNA polymerase Rpb7 N-terminal [Penicillium alfredii]|uniref:DNA-directed RNA polymerase subunit n=1 Tax=Penicillium alfredii TaxID=1506179 RepID=A0A9W9FA04_9EURO|nr:RNA polymerase Rpb7 N-terminal [Penicillium alfredii]KAJ5096311.1 RNA polymerase Rpb7 N-terminal [Penicillium alfredii]
MAVDAMDIDTSPARTVDERKRKHKNKDATPSKKRKQTETLKSSASSKSKKGATDTTSTEPKTEPDSPFTLTTATIYLPLSPISISPTHALASLLAEHLSPLLLTYFPPLKGIVLAYSNASISSRPPSSTGRPSSDPNPQPLTLATTADEYGVLYVYLTATFLVFRPKRGQTLEGLVNVQSEGFLGAVVLNLFSVGIERKRLPKNWTWVPPGDEDEEGESAGRASAKKSAPTTDDESGEDREPAGFDADKEHFQPTALAEEITIGGDDKNDDDSATGYFQSVSGHRVRGSVRFRVVDVDVIPGTDRDRGFLSIEGTMLSPAEEESVLEAERQGRSFPPSLYIPPRGVTRIVPLAPPAEHNVSVVDIEAPSEGKEKDKKKKTKDGKDKKDKKSKSKKKEKVHG